VALEDATLQVVFDSDSGALTRLEDKSTHWVVERRPELGVSFRLFAPLPNRRYNPVLGQKQHAAEVKRVSDNKVALRWENPLSENGGALPMKLRAEVALTNGVLTFGATLENDSALTVETIDYPYLGDFNPPSRDAALFVRTMNDGKVTDLLTNGVYPQFRNEKGYWGVSFPTKTLEAEQSPFCLIQAQDGGLYCEVTDPKAYRLQYTFEQHPGLITGDRVPQTDDISGWPVHLEFRFCHFVFARPHSTTNLAPIVVRSYKGDWRNGADLYRVDAKSH
jgi:hypothetical protein